MYQWTTEAVSKGHPDKLADQISDAVLDAYLSINPNLRVACECMLMSDLIVVAGEVSPCDPIDIESVVRTVLKNVGYDRPEHSYDGNKVAVLNKMTVQSPEIAQAVAKDDGRIGAGDQGIMFGYANNATKEFMPLAHHLAFKFINALEADISKNRNGDAWGSFFLPDAKTQVTISYEDDVPKHVETVVVSTQHRPDVSLKELREYVLSVIVPSVEASFPDLFKKTNYLINPAGAWNFGGPAADTGLTGRKIVIDNYGADCPIGGGAFSGKDPTKVDRSAAYMARYLAKNVVASGFSERATVQLSYAIGVEQPTSVRLITSGWQLGNGNSKSLNEMLTNQFFKLVDLSPSGIIERFDLRRPIYAATASGGHFGRNEFPWEKVDLNLG